MTVHVVGNACVDLSFWLSEAVPAGVTVLARRWAKAVGGKGLNQATAAARAGAETVLWAAVGDDSDAELVQAHLVAEGIGLDGLAYQPGATDQSVIWIEPDGDNRIVSAADQAKAFQPAENPDFRAALTAGDVVAAQGNLQPAATESAFRLARATRARTVLNPSPLRDGAWPDLSLADLVVLNAQEIQAITGQSAMPLALQHVHEQTAAAVVLTLGAEGAVLVAAPGAELQGFAAPVVEVVDTSGAGDALFGTLVALWAAGWELKPALQAAIRVAARAVERPGALAGLPPVGEVRALIGEGTEE